MKEFGWLLATIFVVVVGFFLLKVLLFPVHVANTAMDSTTGVIDKTLDSDNVIFNYEWFHRQYGDYLAMKPKLANANFQLKAFEDTAGPHSGWSFEDKQEHARLSSIVLGLQNQLAELTQTYNAHAAMSNRSIFIGTDLPNHID